jgi:2-amino-4-hydroxy-6-hydroxymethyldihydropteridine diphosphokinase
MKIVAIGSNLELPGIGGPAEVCEAALERLETAGVTVSARSGWYRSAPVPASDQPDFINGILSVSWEAGPESLMAKLHEIEGEFGRIRSVPNAARTLDLDLIDYDGMVREGPGSPVLPHPRMRGRAFVLMPLSELAPGWRHPVDGAPVATLLAALPPGQECVRTEPADRG